MNSHNRDNTTMAVSRTHHLVSPPRTTVIPTRKRVT